MALLLGDGGAQIHGHTWAYKGIHGHTWGIHVAHVIRGGVAYGHWGVQRAVFSRAPRRAGPLTGALRAGTMANIPIRGGLHIHPSTASHCVPLRASTAAWRASGGARGGGLGWKLSRCGSEPSAAS